MMKKTIVIGVCCVIFFPSTVLGHICDNIFWQADKIVIKPEVSNLVLEKEASFKVYMQSNMRPVPGFQGTIMGNVRLVGRSPAFDIDISPAGGFNWISPGKRYEFTVKLRLKPGLSSGNYPIDFNAMVGNRTLRSYSMKMALEDKAQEGAFLKVPVFSGSSPSIDGRLSEECWKNALQVQTLLNTRNEKPVHPAAAFFTGDGSSIYVAVAVRENGRQNGGQGRDIGGSINESDKTGDSLMVLVAPPGLQTVYCFEVSRSGELTISNVVNGKKTAGVSNINAVRAAVIRSNHVWYIEMCIPLKSMGLDTALAGEKWRMNIVRECRDGQGETSFWSGSPETYLRPEVFGELVFAR